MRLARTFLLALMAVLVPLQGAMAVSAGQCMALGHHDAPDHGDGHEHHGEADTEKSSHCGPCVACCASAAIAPTMKTLVQSQSAPHVVSLAQPPRPGTPPDQHFRPPLAL